MEKSIKFSGIITVYLLLFSFFSLYAADTSVTVEAETTIYMIPDNFFGSNPAS